MKAMGKVTLTLGLMIIVSLFLTSCSGVVTPELQLDLDTEETVIEDTEEPGTVYPQKWATGDGTAENPWANDCIQKAYDFVPAGGTIFLKAGYYVLSAVVKITKKVNIIGEGINKTIIITADANGLHIDTIDYITIKNLTVDGDAQTTDGTINRYCIGIGRSDYTLLENIEVKNAARYGIDINTTNHLSLLNIYAHDNYRHGVHTGTNVPGTNIYNIYRDIYCWGNGVAGFDDSGNQNNYPTEDTYNLYDNLQCWDNGGPGISIFCQSKCVISNTYVWGNGGVGLSLWHLNDFNIHDCFANLNGSWGVLIRCSNNLSFTNVIVKNNNVNDGYNPGGIKVRESNGTRFTSCQSYDDRATPLQRYGLSTEDSVDYVEFVNCKLLPNLKGAIYNPAGAVIIEEIKLVRF